MIKIVTIDASNWLDYAKEKLMEKLLISRRIYYASLNDKYF